MSDDKTKKCQLDLIYSTTDASTAEMTALRDELVKRGYPVNLKSYTPQTNLIQEISQSARDLAQSAKEVADAATQKIKEALNPIVNIADTKKKDDDAKKGDAGKKEVVNPFQEIGNNSNASEDRAIIVTDIASLMNTPWDTFRIGLIPHTELTKPWMPAQLDAIVTPHPAMRSYLESVKWDAERIFEGGWLSTTRASDTPDAIRTKFGLSREAGPIILILAQTLNSQDIQTIMLQLSLIRVPYQAFFYYGDNASNATELRNHACRFGVNARMFGKLGDLADYFAIADLAIAPQDDPNFSMLEPLGIPTFVLSPNATSGLSQFLIHAGAGVLVRYAYELASHLAGPVSQKEVLDNMQKVAKTLAEGASVAKCADAIEAALAAKDKLKNRTPSAREAVAGFETIGSMPQAAPAGSFLAPTAPVQATNSPFETVSPASPMVPVAQPNAYVQPQNAYVQPGMIQPQSGYTAPIQPTLAPAIVPNPRAYKDLHKEYTQLLLTEKQLDRSLDLANDEVRKWEERLDLARQNNNDKLFNEAMLRLKTAQATEMQLFQQKDQLTQQKNILRQSAHQYKGSTPIVEDTFIDDEFSKPEDDQLEKEFKNLQRRQRLLDLRHKMGLN